MAADAILLSDFVTEMLTTQLGHQSQLRLLSSEVDGAQHIPHQVHTPVPSHDHEIRHDG